VQKSAAFVFCAGASRAMLFFRREVEVSVYFFCLDAKKVTKKDQGYPPPLRSGGHSAQLSKNGRVSPAQKKLAGKVC
jgi:hypothetical protein